MTSIYLIINLFKRTNLRMKIETISSLPFFVIQLVQWNSHFNEKPIYKKPKTIFFKTEIQFEIQKAVACYQPWAATATIGRVQLTGPLNLWPALSTVWGSKSLNIAGCVTLLQLKIKN